MADNVKNDATKTKIDLGLLEEDDEFEEFPADGKLNYSSLSIMRLEYSNECTYY